MKSTSRIVRNRLAAAVGLPPSTSVARPTPTPRAKMALRPYLALRRDIIEQHDGPDAAREFERRIAAGERVA